MKADRSTLPSGQALDLESTKDNKLGPIVEELADLKAVWTALSGVWAQIAEIREMSWSSVQVCALAAPIWRSR